MPKLWELARLIRSKNAGPFQLTFDVMFEEQESYELVRDAGLLSPELFSRLYGTPVEDVHVVAYDPGRAIKVTIPRPTVSGDLGDTDIFGGQQYGPLVDLDVPERDGARPAAA
jgi:hypothetical protein